MTEFILVLSAVFITAGAMLLVANQLGLHPIPFYLIAGLGVGVVIEEQVLITLALWGIAFLVFVFGIRVDLRDLQSVLRDGEVAAFTQLLVVAPVAFLVGYALGQAFGFDDPARNAIYFSAAATLGSTIVGARLLEAEIRNNLVYGRLASAVHFFDDLVAIGAVLVLSTEVLTDLDLVSSKIGYGVVLLLAGLLVSRHGFPLLVRVADGEDELILMGSISILIVFISAAELLDVPIVVGAFAAGLAIGLDGGKSIGVRNGIESIRDFFAAIFFVTVGALVTVPGGETLLIAGLLIVLVVFLNPLVYTIAFVYEGYGSRTGFIAGSSLNQVSEFALVIAIQAALLGTIERALFDAIILAAAATMILSTVTGRYRSVLYESVVSQLFSGQTEFSDRYSDVDDGLQDHVVIVGYGRKGRRIVRELEAAGVPYVTVENDPVVRDRLAEDCQHYVFGDAMDEYSLDLARLSEATLIVSTVDHRGVSEALLSASDDTAKPPVMLRADTARVAKEFLDAGALYVSVPGVLAADQLVETVNRVLEDRSEAEELKEEHLAFVKSIEMATIEREIGG